MVEQGKGRFPCVDWSSLILEVDEPCDGRSIGETEREVVRKCA